MEIKIACPQCGRKYNLKAPNPAALMTKTFNCPKCEAKVAFAPLLRKAGIPLSPDSPVIPGGIHDGRAIPPTGMNSGVNINPNSPVTNLITGDGNQVAATGHTMVAGPAGKKLAGGVGQRGFFLIKESGKVIPLAQGRHILGRDSSDSGATLRIAPDPYMSRRHAHLEVVAIGGGVLRSMITGLNSGNDIFINGGRIRPGATVQLTPGDEILLGMTTLCSIVK